MLRLMRDMLKLIWWVVIGLFRSRASLEAEIVALRHQLNVLRKKSTKRLAFSNFDRLIFAGLYFYCVINAIGLQVVGASTDSMDIARGILRARR